MSNVQKKINSLPTLPRIALGSLLFFGGLWALVELEVNSNIEAAVDAASQAGEIEYADTFWRFNGDFGISDVRVSRVGPDGKEASYSADKMTIHTPGLFWLLRAAWSGTPDELPDAIGVSFANFRDLGEDDDTPGNYTNQPYDALGCGKPLLTPGDLAEMGFPELRRDATFRFDRIDDATSRIKMELVTHDVGTFNAELDIGVERPVEWETGPLALAAAPIKKASMTITDHGFVTARNAHCAKKAGLDATAFTEHHMRAVRAFLGRNGQTLGVGALDRYKAFSQKGGVLSIASTADPKLTLADLGGMESMGRLRAFRMGIRHDDGPLVAFEMGTGPRIEIDESAPLETAVAGAPGAEAAPPVAERVVVSAGVAKAGTMADDPAGGEVVAYKDLEQRIGAHVEITTKMGSVRRGTVLSSNTFITQLKLDAAEGGFNLGVPGDTVAQVRMIPEPAAAASPPTAAPAN